MDSTLNELRELLKSGVSFDIEIFSTKSMLTVGWYIQDSKTKIWQIYVGDDVFDIIGQSVLDDVKRTLDYGLDVAFIRGGE